SRLSRASVVVLLPISRPLVSTLFPYTTLFRSDDLILAGLIFVFFQKLSRAGKSDLGDILLHFFFRHAKTSINELQRLFFRIDNRSEEHTSELQSRFDLVCRLLLEKKHNNYTHP